MSQDSRALVCLDILVIIILTLPYETPGQANLLVLVQPQFGYVRQPLVVQPSVKVLGNFSVSSSVQASISLPNTGGALLLGQRVVTVASGFASFTNLEFSSSGTYRLSFVLDGVGDPVLSDTIDVQV